MLNIHAMKSILFPEIIGGLNSYIIFCIAQFLKKGGSILIKNKNPDLHTAPKTVLYQCDLCVHISWIRILKIPKCHFQISKICIFTVLLGLIREK